MNNNKNKNNKFFLPITGLSHHRNFNYKNVIYGLIKEHYLTIL